jgi:hypothetical protein
MNLSLVPIPNPSVLCRTIDDETVLVNADTAASLSLANHTALVVWELVDGCRSGMDIVEEIKKRFRDVPSSVSEDISALFDLLIADGFVGFELTGQDMDCY